MTATFWAFPGQGSQISGMGRRLFARSEAATAFVSAAEAETGINLRDFMWRSSNEVLTRTENAQPAVVAVSLAALAAWSSNHPGNEPVWVAGHSVGSLAAAAAAGALNPYRAIALARQRGEFMAGAPGTGGMLAVAVSHEDSRKRVEEFSARHGLDLACFNGRRQLVISGRVEAIRLARQEFGARSVELPVSHAFHSRLMGAAVPAWREELARTELADPRFPYLSSRTGNLLDSAAAVRADLEHGIREPVRWDLVSRKAAECEAGVVFGTGAALLRMWRGEAFAESIEVIDDMYGLEAHV